MTQNTQPGHYIAEAISHLDGPEFEGIFLPDDYPHRPPMSVPPRNHASAKLVRQVRVECDLDDETAERVADWAADWGERLAASAARPVFDMGGHGPQCSWCRAIWPLCGHHHLSTEGDTDE